MGIWKGAIFFVLLAAGIGFAIQNDQPISLKYYFGWISLPLPMFLWAFLAILLGLIFSGIMALISRVTLSSQIRQRKKTVNELEQRLIRLKEGQTSP